MLAFFSLDKLLSLFVWELQGYAYAALIVLNGAFADFLLTSCGC